jgi:hypothetical protein
VVKVFFEFVTKYVCNDPQRGPHRYQWAAVHRSSHIAKMGLTTADQITSCLLSEKCH